MVALPFTFRYYGGAFSSVTFSSNGFLVFGPSPATAWINSPLPNTAVPNGVVAAYWDDLEPGHLHGNPAQDHGASATIGLESPDGTLGTQFIYNQPLLAPYQATTALRYTNR